MADLDVESEQYSGEHSNTEWWMRDLSEERVSAIKRINKFLMAILLKILLKD